MPKAPTGRPVNEENLLSPYRKIFKFLNKAMKYAQYYFRINCGKKMKCCST